MSKELDAVHESRERLRRANTQAQDALDLLRLDVARAHRAGHSHGEIAKAAGFLSPASVSTCLATVAAKTARKPKPGSWKGSK